MISGRRLVSHSLPDVEDRRGPPRRVDLVGGGSLRAGPRGVVGRARRLLMSFPARSTASRSSSVSFGAAYSSLAARAKPSTPLIPMVVISPAVSGSDAKATYR